MWKQIRADCNDFIIKKVSVHGHHKVLLSNFVNIWGEEITSASLYGRCKVRPSLWDTVEQVKYYLNVNDHYMQ
jgi:hypothetical protein